MAVRKKLFARKVLDMLLKKYPGAGCTLRHANAWQLLVATVLSAQSNDKQVNIVTRSFFRKYGGPKDFAAASQAEIENEIKSLGLYRAKAKNLRATAKIVVEKYGGMVPGTMAELVELPGIGRKTANIILSNAFGKLEGIAVDTHVRRLAGRLGLTGQKTPEKIEKDLMELFPRRYWLKISDLLIRLGRDVCNARKPMCSACPLQRICPSSSVIGKEAR